MKNLQQEIYEDDNGQPIEAAKVDTLGSYVLICDGFYNWTCGACGAEHSDRWIKFSGRVLKCGDCGKMNLLVRTNTDAVTEALQGKWKSEEMEKENARLKDIVKFNSDQLWAIRNELVQTVDRTLTEAIRKKGA